MVNALAPAEVQSVVVDEVKAWILLMKSNYRAIGRNGQNIRLASD